MIPGCFKILLHFCDDTDMQINAASLKIYTELKENKIKPPNKIHSNIC